MTAPSRWFLAAALLVASTCFCMANTVVASQTDAGDVLAILTLCGLMGLIGQGCRVIVGFATIATSKAVAPAENRDVVDLARLSFSLIVGFIAGVVTALAQWKSQALSSIAVKEFNSLLPFAIAGYIGTDVVEAFTGQFLETRKKAASPEHEPFE